MKLASLKDDILKHQPSLLIFDIDGTLYSLAKMQFLMSLWLAIYYSLRFWRWRELFILRQYRLWRNQLTGNNFTSDDELYRSFASSHHLDWQWLKALTESWFFTKPLLILKYCRYPDLADLLIWCRSIELKLAVFSDYPPTAKIDHLGYSFDYIAYTLNSGGLKPNPASLLLIASHFNLSPSDCLVLGDLDNKDGLSASSAGMSYINITAYQKD